MGKLKKTKTNTNAMFNIGTALNVGFIGLDMYSNLKEGDGLVKAGVKAGANFMLWEAVASVVGVPALLGYGIASALTSFAQGAIVDGRENAQTMVSGSITGGQAIGGNRNVHSEVSSTMQQRQLEQMGGYSNMIRGTLGSEGRRRALMARYY